MQRKSSKICFFTFAWKNIAWKNIAWTTFAFCVFTSPFGPLAMASGRPVQSEQRLVDSSDEQRPIPESTEELIQWLSSPIFRERKVAEEKLLAGGIDSIAVVAHLIHSDKQEVAWRAQRMLLGYFTDFKSTDDTTFRRIQLILDLAIAAGHEELLPAAIAAKENMSTVQAKYLVEQIQKDPEVQLTVFPNFPGRIIVINGQVVEANQPARSTREIQPEPTTLEGARFAKDNYDSLIDEIVKQPNDALNEIASRLRNQGINLQINNTSVGNVDFGISSIFNEGVRQQTLEYFAQLSKLVTQVQLSIHDLELTDQRQQWLMTQLDPQKVQVLSISQCTLKAEQLDALEARFGGDYFSISGRAMIGIKGNELLNANGDFLGAVVTEVTPGSGADNAGLVRGDRIVVVNGKKVRDFKHLRHLVAAFAPNDEIQLSIVRTTDGEEKELDVKIQLTPYNQ